MTVITLDSLAFLQSEIGMQALNTLQRDALVPSQTLAILTRLRKQYTPEQASVLLEMAQLRQKAVLKFGDVAPYLFFTADALEQASDPLVRAYRASHTNGRVLDVCCSIGADSLAFAQAGCAVLGLDIDPVRVAIAQHNAQVLGATAHFEVADVTQGLPSDYDTLFFDPARRDDDGKRIYHVEHYQPPLSIINNWQTRRLMVKVSPGVDVSQLTPYGGGVEFISVNGDLKEAVLRVDGTLTGTLATLITAQGVHHYQRSGIEPSLRVQAPQGWLLEPDASILRSGLVRDLAAELDAWMLDETIAYLSVSQKPSSGWVRAWQINDWMPFNVKLLRAYLRERNIGRVTVKKRGSPLTPEELTAQLKLKGQNACTLVLTRYQGDPIVLICSDL